MAGRSSEDASWLNIAPSSAVCLTDCTGDNEEEADDEEEDQDGKEEEEPSPPSASVISYDEEETDDEEEEGDVKEDDEKEKEEEYSPSSVAVISYVLCRHLLAPTLVFLPRLHRRSAVPLSMEPEPLDPQQERGRPNRQEDPHQGDHCQYWKLSLSRCRRWLLLDRLAPFRCRRCHRLRLPRLKQ